MRATPSSYGYVHQKNFSQIFFLFQAQMSVDIIWIMYNCIIECWTIQLLPIKTFWKFFLYTKLWRGEKQDIHPTQCNWIHPTQYNWIHPTQYNWIHPSQCNWNPKCLRSMKIRFFFYKQYFHKQHKVDFGLFWKTKMLRTWHRTLFIDDMLSWWEMCKTSDFLS